MAVETFANAPIPSIPSTAWTTLFAGIDASVTSLTVVSAASFPAAAQYRVLIDNELLLVTAGGGTTTWTVTRGVEGSTAATHASGANVFHTLTAAGLARHPRSMTTAGDTEYLGSTGAPTRLASPGDGNYVTTWTGGVPSWVAGVVGPASAVDNAIARFDGTTGKIIQDYTSGAPTIGDTGAVSLTVGSASVPSLTFGTSNTGLYGTGTSIIEFAIGGTNTYRMSANGFFFAVSAGKVVLSSAGAFSFEPGIAGNTNPDVLLYRDAAGVLAQRDGTIAQKTRVYNTFTTVNTAGEWFAIDWQTTANVCGIGAVKGSSSGTARVLNINYGGAQASPIAAISVPITSGSILFGGGIDLSTNYLQLAEMTAPSAGAANSVRLFIEDNGSGKTRLMALFASGVSQQMAIEP